MELGGDLTSALGVWVLAGFDGLEQSRDWRPEDHAGVLGLGKPGPERTWKGQKGSGLSPKSSFEGSLETLVENVCIPEVNQGSWGIVGRPDACVVDPLKRRCERSLAMGKLGAEGTAGKGQQ